MPIGNGGIIGPNNTPSTSSAKGVWSIREAMLAQRAGNWPAVQTPDPFFEYTTLLLPGNGTNGAQNNTFLDSSTNNFTITRNGNTTQGTFSPFSQTGWGNYFSGSSTFVSAPANAAFSYGTGDFTYEAWIYPTADGNASTYRFIMGAGGSGQADQWLINNTGNRTLIYGDGVSAFTTTNQFVLNAWNHVALSRNSGTLRIFINGVLGASGASTASITLGGSQTFYVGNRSGGADSPQQAFVGYMSNVRVLKGVGLYTANFTPPTAPLTAISGTSLLTCQSNRFVDNSSNNFTISKGGDTSVQAFSPFNPTAAWSAATNGGSGYFDGSGDFLSAGTSSAFAFGTGNFTVEAWLYVTAVATYQAIFSSRGSGQGTFCGLETGTTQPVLYNTGAKICQSSVALPLNTWNHVVYVRNGGVSSIYVNGVSVASAADSTNYVSNYGVLSYDVQDNNWPFYGYMSSVRIVNGTAVYTAAFTPPTAPLTAISGTSLLCNFTNAGIYDATSKNDLETVGNAQISTTQSKFGGSSIYVDGTGDVLLARNNTLYGFGTGDFTIEVWVYIVAGTTYGCVIGGPAGGTTWYLEYSSTRGFYFYDNASALNGVSALVTGTWKHLAVSRSGTSLKMFVDGVTTATHTSSANLPAITLGIGAYNDNTYNINGYIQDLRITKGYARYTGTFTPPTTPFPLL